MAVLVHGCKDERVHGVSCRVHGCMGAWCACVSECVSVCVYVCMCVCVYVCTCARVYKNKLCVDTKLTWLLFVLFCKFAPRGPPAITRTQTQSLPSNEGQKDLLTPLSQLRRTWDVGHANA